MVDVPALEIDAQAFADVAGGDDATTATAANGRQTPSMQKVQKDQMLFKQAGLWSNPTNVPDFLATYTSPLDNKQYATTPGLTYPFNSTVDPSLDPTNWFLYQGLVPGMDADFGDIIVNKITGGEGDFGEKLSGQKGVIPSLPFDFETADPVNPVLFHFDGSTNPALGLVVGGSNFGGGVAGAAGGHIVMVNRGNDATDSFAVVSGTQYDIDQTIDTLDFQVKRGGVVYGALDASFGEDNQKTVNLGAADGVHGLGDVVPAAIAAYVESSSGRSGVGVKLINNFTTPGGPDALYWAAAPQTLTTAQKEYAAFRVGLGSPTMVDTWRVNLSGKMYSSDSFITEGAIEFSSTKASSASIGYVTAYDNGTDPTIPAVVPGSTFGLEIKGSVNGHLVLHLDDNDNSDTLAIVSNGGAGGSTVNTLAYEMAPNGVSKQLGDILPFVDLGINIGSGGARINEVYSPNPLNVSDETLKEFLNEYMTPAEYKAFYNKSLDVMVKIGKPRWFRWLDSIAKKGSKEKARKFFGWSAQAVERAFVAVGFTKLEAGLFRALCKDDVAVEWEDEEYESIGQLSEEYIEDVDSYEDDGEGNSIKTVIHTSRIKYLTETVPVLNNDGSVAMVPIEIEPPVKAKEAIYVEGVDEDGKKTTVMVSPAVKAKKGVYGEEPETHTRKKIGVVIKTRKKVTKYITRYGLDGNLMNTWYTAMLERKVENHEARIKKLEP